MHGLSRPVAVVAAALCVSLSAFTEPAPRQLTAVPIKVARPFSHISAARELTNGKILVSDASTPGLWLLDPVSGDATPIGQPGANPDQYTQPAGFYSGAGNTILLNDHSGPRAITLSADGRITGGYSTGRKGTRSSSDSDTDSTKIDARGFAYFMDSGADFRRMTDGKTSGASDLVRLDPVKQTIDVVAHLMVPVQHQVGAGNGMTYTSSTIGDPTDGWDVMPDGRIAIVRASPYRLEWLSPAGKSTLGPVIAYDPIPFTAQDREAAEKTAGRGRVSVGVAGGSSSGNGMPEREYAIQKPVFLPYDVIASPSGHVWVRRTQPFGATATIYDVFDATGARVDRVTMPADSRVIGFGPGSVLVREGNLKNASLRKYKAS
jgi:hypothetical protein